MSIKHGFYIEDFSGCLHDWEYQIEKGCCYEFPFPDWGTFPRVNVDTSYNGEILSGGGDGWKQVSYFEDEFNILLKYDYLKNHDLYKNKIRLFLLGIYNL